MRPVLALTALALASASLASQTQLMKLLTDPDLTRLATSRDELVGLTRGGELLRLKESRYGLKVERYRFPHKVAQVASGPDAVLARLENGDVLRVYGKVVKRALVGASVPGGVKKVVATADGPAVLTGAGGLVVPGPKGPTSTCGDCGLVDVAAAGKVLWLLRADGAVSRMQLEDREVRPFVQFPNLASGDPRYVPHVGRVPGAIGIAGNDAELPHEQKVVTWTRAGEVFAGLAVGTPLDGGDEAPMGRRVATGMPVKDLQMVGAAAMVVDAQGQVRRFGLDEETPGDLDAAATQARWFVQEAPAGTRQVLLAAKAVYVLTEAGEVWRDHRLPLDPVAREQAMKEKLAEFFGGD